MDSLRNVLSSRSSQSDEEAGIMGRISEATKLSWENRLWGFAICFVVGLLFSMVAFSFFFINIGTFAAFYTIGNILSIGSTMFLMGPMKQLKNIFAPTRIIASFVVIAAFVLTLVCAFVVKSIVLALLMVLFQFLALAWYSISYIPFARDAISSIFSSMF